MKIGAIVPYKEMGELVEETFKEHSVREYISKHDNYDYEIEVIVKHDNFNNLKLDCDVIIARGDAVYTLRDIYDIPVVEIPIGAYTIEQAILEAKLKYKTNKIAAIGFVNILVEIEKLQIFSGVNIKTYFITSRMHLKKTIKKAMTEGAEVVLCGVNGQKAAKEVGCKSVLIKSHKQEIWHAITEAKRSAYVNRIQQIKAERFKNILNYSFDGIITLDNNNRVLSYNNAVCRILGIGNQDIDSKNTIINNIINHSDFNKIIFGQQMYTDEIIKFKNKSLMVNKIPIIIKKEKRGCVILFQDITRIQELENKIRKQIYTRGHIAKYNFKDIVGESRKIKETIDIAKEYSNVDSNILIIGQTGTGKEIFAQSIHNHSSRNNGPFVAVNCAALPENLLESELFGYVEGAFTGAKKGGKLGYFELAHQGTIFLDEISEITLKLQGRLLRVIQEKEIVRIGSNKVTPVDVRIIAASNKDLKGISKEGSFREDLYYRLDVLRIEIPSLNERKEDIPLIANKFIENYKIQFSKPNINVVIEDLKILKNVNWEGNVRQLRNICERLVVINKSDIIDETEIKKLINTSYDSTYPGNEEKEIYTDKDYNIIETNLKKQKIIEALNKYEGNRSKASKELGIGRATLYRRMKKMGLM